MRAMNVHTGLLALAGVPAVAIIVLAGDPFLRLVYGEEFGASSLELFAFGTAALLCTLGYVNAATMLVLNWYRGQLVVTVASLDRKSTRLNSSHVAISYAVFCLNKN